MGDTPRPIQVDQSQPVSFAKSLIMNVQLKAVL